MSYAEIPDIEYEGFCGLCHGSGKASYAFPEKRCETCQGTGYYTTPEGDKLLRFLKRHGFRDIPIGAGEE